MTVSSWKNWWCRVSDEQVEEALAGIAGQNKSYKDAAKTKKAADGDQLIIDFVGKLDGVEFEGGKAEDAALVLGSGTFIPGFEEQLVGVKTGQEKTITVTFPAEYQAEHLAGKEATFDVTVKAVKVETETKIDEDFAKESRPRQPRQAQGNHDSPAGAADRRSDPHPDEASAARSGWAAGVTISRSRRRWSKPSSKQIWGQLQQEARAGGRSRRER